MNESSLSEIQESKMSDTFDSGIIDSEQKDIGTEKRSEAIPIRSESFGGQGSKSETELLAAESPPKFNGERRRSVSQGSK